MVCVNQVTDPILVVTINEGLEISLEPETVSFPNEVLEMHVYESSGGLGLNVTNMPPFVILHARRVVVDLAVRARVEVAPRVEDFALQEEHERLEADGCRIAANEVPTGIRPEFDTGDR